uniref:RNA-binding protein 41 n=1 Tax=Cacopsylla melanoneura TaxID=428564 RepID=A0A8D8T0R7_9HEMI
MAERNSTRSKRLDSYPTGCQHVQSMGDDFLEDLAFRQQDKQYSIIRLLNDEREFQSSHTFKPITEYNKGTTSLQSFVSNVDSNEPPQPSTSSDNEQPLPYLGLSRHEYDILTSVKPNSETTKLLTFALANKKGNERNNAQPAFIHRDHPINHLQDIHDKVFSNADPHRTAQTIVRKRKQLLQYYSEPIGPEQKSSKSNSLWDVKDLNSVTLNSKRQYTAAPLPDTKHISIGSKSRNSSNPDYNHKKEDKKEVTKSQTETSALQGVSSSKYPPQGQKSSALKDSSGGQPFVAPPGCQMSEAELKLIPRFTEDEIRMIPRFQNWSKGCQPSKTLYIKNLSNKVTDTDLASIFQHYQDAHSPRIVYRLMTSGKMRGQAFVDFHNVQMAERALEERNGLALKDKPIVIQFARNKD